MSAEKPDAFLLRVKRAASRARKFPTNTDPYSRHVHIMADCLSGRHRRYPMLDEEPLHCAGSLYATIANLWELRTLVMRAVGTDDLAEAEAVLRKVGRV